ncbi:MAG: Trm112 family protein [Armatimonadetes bacterium]|nr:Trm112 family protein [Armatimonadota bacterium]
MIDPRLLDILACPQCDDRPALKLDGEELVCPKCNTRYPIINGIPQLVVPNDDPPPPKKPDHG